MIIRIISTIIFTLGFIISFKDYKIMFYIMKSRIQEEDTITIKGKNYSVQGKTWKILIVVSVSICVLISTLLTIVFAWCYSDLQIFENLISLLLPLNYSLELSKISTNTINKFVSEYLSIEDMKNFTSADELTAALKVKKQYLTEQEAKELNLYFHGDKSLEWVELNGFKCKAYQKELEKETCNKRDITMVNKE